MGRNQSINDVVEECRIKIFNASDDPIIKARLLPFGYTDEKHQQNKDLYQSTIDLIQLDQTETAQWKTACERFNAQQEKSRLDFKKVRQYLKFYYPAPSPEANYLELYEDNYTRYSNFVQAAKTFYSRLIGTEEALEKLLPFKLTTETITAYRDEVFQLDQLRADRQKESGDAQYATKVKNAKIDELYLAAAEITRLAKLIFQDNEAQYLEKLGILARS